jgi:hypothetical protein
MDRVKKLHVDRHVPGEREAAMPDAWNLVRRLARCARSEVDTRTTEELIEEAQRWLESDDHKELVRSALLELGNIFHYYVVSGSGRCFLGSDQVQVSPRTISRPASYDCGTTLSIAQG